MSTTERRLIRYLRFLPLTTKRRVLFAWDHHRIGRITHPVTYTEKLVWRACFDRSDRLAWTCDKLAMKDHARRLAPSIRVPRTLWHGTDLSELDAIELPDRWILKANNRSGAVHPGRGRPDVGALAELTRDWLTSREVEYYGEWAYSQARPVLFVEEWIGDDETPPPDYKLFTFGGRVGVVETHHDRFTAHTARYYSPGWEPIEAVTSSFGLAPIETPPARLADMIDAAERIAAGFDHLRIDLYAVGDDVYFGETTPYSGAGRERITPRSFDEYLGSMWEVPERRAVRSGVLAKPTAEPIVHRRSSGVA